MKFKNEREREVWTAFMIAQLANHRHADDCAYVADDALKLWLERGTDLVDDAPLAPYRRKTPGG